MIIPDINLLMYAYDSTSPSHKRAAQWWTSCLSGSTPVGMAWMVALGFIRLWTNSRVFANPMPIALATAHVESWLDRRTVSILNPGPRHAELVFGFLRAEGKGGNLITDAHLAALAVEFRGTIHTADTDFLRFSGVPWRNPLSPE